MNRKKEEKKAITFRIDTQCVFKQRNGFDGALTFETSNHISESHGFYDVKVDHVTMVFMEL